MCSCQMNGMKRKRIGKKGDMFDRAKNSVTNEVLPAALGYVVGEILDKQLTLLSNNAMTGNLVKIAGGLLLDSMGDGILFKMGTGLAANGVVGVALPALQKAGIAGVNLLPPGVPSYHVSGLSGVSETPEKVKMQ